MRGSRSLRQLASVAVISLAAMGAALAQSGDDPAARLRSALREAIVKQRELEDQNATLQAKQAELERDRQAAVQKAATAEKELKACAAREPSTKMPCNAPPMPRRKVWPNGRPPTRTRPPPPSRAMPMPSRRRRPWSRCGKEIA